LLKPVPDTKYFAKTIRAKDYVEFVKRQKDGEDADILMAMYACCDSDGNRSYSNDDYDKAGELDMLSVQAIARTAVECLGIDLKKNGVNSSPTVGNDSSSASPPTTESPSVG
jgi:hypothetical protein